MKSLNEYKIFESLTEQEFKEKFSNLEKQIQKIFPNSYINISLKSNLGKSVNVSFFLIGDDRDFINGTSYNDPCRTTFMMHYDSLDKPFSFELVNGGAINTKPTEGSYYAMEKVKVPYRKSTSDIDKQIKNILEYFKKFGKAIIENKDNIYGVEEINPKYFEIKV